METTLTNEPTTEAWIDAAEASRRLGISVRAVQRRCRNGKLEARLVPVANGQQWEINPASLVNIRPDSPDTYDSDTDDDDSDGYDTNDTHTAQKHISAATDTTGTTQTTAVNPDAPTDTTLNSHVTATPTTQEATTQTTGTTGKPDTNDGSDSDTRDRYDTTTPSVEADLRLQLEEKRDEVKFLRGLIEQRDRDAAELRATLRKMVEAQPKQLGQGREPEATEHLEAAPVERSLFKRWFGGSR